MEEGGELREKSENEIGVRIQLHYSFLLLAPFSLSFLRKQESMLVGSDSSEDENDKLRFDPESLKTQRHQVHHDGTTKEQG